MSLLIFILFLPSCDNSAVPDLLCYDIEYLAGYYYWNHNESPTNINDIIIAYEELQQEWPNNPHEATYHYLCKHKKQLFLFVVEDMCYYVDLYNINYNVIPLKKTQGTI